METYMGVVGVLLGFSGCLLMYISQLRAKISALKEILSNCNEALENTRQYLGKVEKLRSELMLENIKLKEEEKMRITPPTVVTCDICGTEIPPNDTPRFMKDGFVYELELRRLHHNPHGAGEYKPADLCSKCKAKLYAALDCDVQ